MKCLRFRLFSALSIILAAANSYASSPGDSSYFPLRVGNVWTFRKDSYIRTERIVDTMRASGFLYFRFDTLSGQPGILLREDGGQTYFRHDAASELLYDFAADSGKSWNVTYPAPTNLSGQMTVRSTKDLISVPAGTFADCRQFEFFVGMDAVTYEWFAKGVGIVKRTCVTIAGATIWALYKAIVSVADPDRTSQPSLYALGQNHPNPFNPTTVIEYTVGGSRGHLQASHQAGGRAAEVRLVVYDLLGREVAILANESMQPGTYEVTFDAQGLSSGMYFYKLQSPEVSIVKKMLLLR